MHNWRKGKLTEYQASIKKFLDRNKECLKRLKALRHGLEKSSPREVKDFYTKHSTDIFYVVYGSFTTLETSIQDKLLKGRGYNDGLLKELQDIILPQFRQIFISLPELVHKKWQFNSICLVLRKLLHPENHMKLRCYGVQLLVLWVEALQENADVACMELFASFMPHFPPDKTPMGLPGAVPTSSMSSPAPSLIEKYGVYSESNPTYGLGHWGGGGQRLGTLHRSSSAILIGSNGTPIPREVVCPNVLIPLLSCGSDHQPSESVTEELMICLLDSLTEQTHWLQWDDPKQHCRGFAHLFFLFKLFYLACLYKDFQNGAGLYTPPTPPVIGVDTDSPSDVLDPLIEEPAHDTDKTTPTPAEGPSLPKYKRKRTSPYRMSTVIKLEYDLSHPIYEKVKNIVLKYVLRWFLSPLPSSSSTTTTTTTTSDFPSGVEQMKNMWFTTRDNVSLLLEICRQGFLTLTNPTHKKQLVDLYRHWNQVVEKPRFMLAPPPAPGPVQSTDEASIPRQGASVCDPALSVLSWEELSSYRGFQVRDVEAGVSASLCMIIAHTQQVFVPREEQPDLQLQIELCRKVIRLYQDIAVSWLLDKTSWEYLLAVLLHHTKSLLTNEDTSLGYPLANPILKTLLVCFLRASSAIDVSPGLWDSLLHVLHSLTHWKEVIVQWKAVMESITEVLTQVVYSLSLTELPLDTLASTLRGRTSSVGQKHNSSRREIAPPRMASFSAIIMGPPAPYKKPLPPGATKLPPKIQSIVDSKKADPNGHDQVISSGRGHFTRSATHEEKGTPSLVPAVKRHSTPIVTPTWPRPSLNSSLGPISELSKKQEVEEACPHPTSPTRPLLEKVCPQEEEKEPNSVFANLNTTSPSPPPPPDPSSPSSSSPSSSTTTLVPSSQKAKSRPFPSLEDTSSPPLQDKSKKKTLNPFRHHRSPDSKARKKILLDEEKETSLSPLLPRENSGKPKKKKKTQHKRSESDITAQSIYGGGSLEQKPSESSEVGGVVSTKSNHALTKSVEMERKVFKIRKSSSDGNLHRISLSKYGHPLLDDRGDGRRVAEPLLNSDLYSSSSIDDNSVSGSTISPPPTSRSRLLRRSITMDSPEPIFTDHDDTHLFGHTSPVPPLSLSPTAGVGGKVGAGGWRIETASIVWLRMLKILGNINEIKEESIHAEAMKGLQDTWKALCTIRDNSGISLDGITTPPLPRFMPPLDLLLPWVIQACSLPLTYSRGREIAHQLLCEMTIFHWHTSPSLSHLAHFYRLLHLALQTDMAGVVVKYGCHLFSHGLSGASVLLIDFVSACRSILASPSNSTTPHNEALYLLGSLLYLPALSSSLPLPNPSLSPTSKDVLGHEFREQIVDILFSAALSEKTRIARCISLYLVGTLVYSELHSNKPSRRLPDGVDVLLTSLHFSDRGVALCAIDMMSLLCEVAPQIYHFYPSMLCRILKEICYAIAVFLTEELDHAAWVDRVVVTLLLLLRDWVMVLPLHSLIKDSPIVDDTIKTVFEVLQGAAGNPHPTSKHHHHLSQLFTIRSGININMDQLETSHGPVSMASPGHTHLQSTRRKGDVQLSAISSQDGRIRTAARSVLTHLLNMLGHFPFGCGAAQFTSSVKEYHDCPSLYHLEEMSPEVFDSPRMQFFALNDTAIVSLVEIPTMLDGVPGQVSAAPYQTRVIVRDVTGKYTWDSTFLYGPGSSVDDTCSLFSEESLDSLVDSIGTSSETPLSSDWSVSRSDPLQPPSWRTHANSDRDVLQDLLEHVEETSPECVVPVVEDVGGPCDQEGGVPHLMPTIGKGEEGDVEAALLHLLHQQETQEKIYLNETLSQPGVRGEKATAPSHFPHTLAFHHCRIFLSHLGLLSWDKRNHLNLLEKTNQLILELKHLDLLNAQSRAIYKIAVLYVAPGQEDKSSILSNNGGSKSYEDFVAGLGWEVNMETHAGYMAGMQKEFASCSMPYYATSSEEVLFHVATRMSYRMEQKVRHLGNDEVHIVWSEHWRDYRRSIIRTDFADVLIILQPLSNGLIRVHINKKSSVHQFGPLYDGALVDRDTVAPLVRATAINALRAQRSPLIQYRARYEERLKDIQSITSHQILSTYEGFCENVMHPLEMSSSQSVPANNSTPVSRASPQKPPSAPSLTNLLRSIANSSHQNSSLSLAHHTPNTTPSSSLLLLAHAQSDQSPRRQRSNTNDERFLLSFNQSDFASSPSHRNASVPDNLNNLSLSDSHSHSSPLSRRRDPHTNQSPSLSHTNISHNS